MHNDTALRPTLLVAGPAVEDDPFGLVGWLLFGALAVIWGSSFLLIAWGLEALPPALVTFARVALGALFLAVLPREKVAFEKSDRVRMVVMSILWVGIPFTIFPIAEQHINSAVTGLLNGATPIVAAGIAAVFLRRPPDLLQTVGIIVGFAGIVLISLPSLNQGTSEAAAVLMVLFATVCYGISIHLAPPLQHKYGSVNVMARMLALGTLWTAPLALFELDQVRFAWGPWLSVGMLGLVGTGLAFALMAAMVKRVGATRSSLIAYLLPIVALFLGVVVNGDEVSHLAVFGVAMILVGAAVAARPKTNGPTARNT